jgi:hypothetical protein
MRLRGDAHSLSPIRRQLTEPLTPVIAGGGVPRDPARSGIREFAGFADANPSTVARVIEDLKQAAPPPGNRPALGHVGVPTATGRPGGNGEGKSFGGAI